MDVGVFGRGRGRVQGRSSVRGQRQCEVDGWWLAVLQQAGNERTHGSGNEHVWAAVSSKQEAQGA